MLLAICRSHQTFFDLVWYRVNRNNNPHLEILFCVLSYSTIYILLWYIARCNLCNIVFRAPLFPSYLLPLQLLTGAEIGGARGATAPQILTGPPVAPPKFFRSLSESPTQIIDSSPCCKTGPSSGPPK